MDELLGTRETEAELAKALVVGVFAEPVADDGKSEKGGGLSKLFKRKKKPTAGPKAAVASTPVTCSLEDYTRDLARRSDAVQRAADIARNHPALLLVHGSDDAMLGSKDVATLRDALAPFYKSPRDEPRLRLTFVDGLSHGWASSPHVDEVRRSIAAWFNAS